MYNQHELNRHYNRYVPERQMKIRQKNMIIRIDPKQLKISHYYVDWDLLDKDINAAPKKIIKTLKTKLRSLQHIT